MQYQKPTALDVGLWPAGRVGLVPVLEVNADVEQNMVITHQPDYQDIFTPLLPSAATFHAQHLCGWNKLIIVACQQFTVIKRTKEVWLSETQLASIALLCHWCCCKACIYTKMRVLQDPLPLVLLSV